MASGVAGTLARLKDTVAASFIVSQSNGTASQPLVITRNTICGGVAGIVVGFEHAVSNIRITNNTFFNVGGFGACISIRCVI